MSLDGYSEADLRVLLAAADYYAANPVEAFEPSPALAPFMEDNARRILVRAGNRTGKSEHAGARLAKVMLSQPRRKYRAVGVTYVHTVQVVGSILARYLPASQLAHGCSYSPTLGWSHVLIRLRNGTSCQMKNYEQDPKAHAGDDLDGAWCDEPPPAPIWEENRKRVMSRNGFLWVTATPINQPCQYLKEAVEAKGSAWSEHVVEFSHRNCPWYTEQQCEEWIAECRAVPGTFGQTIRGDWEGVTLDRVYTGFDPESLFDDVEEIPKSAKWGIGIDHGESAGKQVALLLAWDDTIPRSPRLWWVDECVSATATTPEQDGEAIVAMLERNGRDVNMLDRWVGDSNSAGKLGPGMKVNDALRRAITAAAKMHQAPFAIATPWKGPGSVAHGERLLNASLLRRWCRVHRRCTTLIHTLSHYAGEEELKHASDAARYVAYPVLDAGSSMPTVRTTGLSPVAAQRGRVY